MDGGRRRKRADAAGACLAGIIANLVGFSSGVSQGAAQASAFWLFALALPLAIVGALGAWRVGAPRFAG